MTAAEALDYLVRLGALVCLVQALRVLRELARDGRDAPRERDREE